MSGATAAEHHAIDVLLAELGSIVMELAVTTLVSSPSARGLTIMVKLVEPPAGMMPRLQINVPPWLVHHDGTATRFTLSGKVSVAMTPKAGDGPWFVIPTV